MKYFLCLLFAFTFSRNLTGQENPLQDELSRLLKASMDSWVSKDSAGFKQTISEHYFATQNGHVFPKDDLLKIITQRPLTRITDFSSKLVTVNDHIAYTSAKMVESSGENGNTGIFCLASFQKEDGVWKVAHSSFDLVPVWKVKEPGDDELEPLAKDACDTESGLKSKNSNIETFIRFKNESDQPVSVYWIDYNGERKKYYDLEPGKTVGGGTYVTHPWIVINKNNVCLGIYHPVDQPGLVRIN